MLTRSALALAVSDGFTGLECGKKLVSTTSRLSTSCALQSTSGAERWDRCRSGRCRSCGRCRQADLLAEHRPAQDRLLIAAQAGQESGERRQGGWSLPRAPAGRNQPVGAERPTMSGALAHHNSVVRRCYTPAWSADG